MVRAVRGFFVHFVDRLGLRGGNETPEHFISTHDPPLNISFSTTRRHSAPFSTETTTPTTMMHFTSVFVAVLAAVRFAGVVAFTGLSVRSSSESSYRRGHVSCLRSGALGSTTPADVSTAAAAAAAMMPMTRRARWRSRLGASEETLGTEGEALSEESDVTNVAAQSAGGAGVDLSKGIAFEAPKPKALEPEQEEESESKKVRLGFWGQAWCAADEAHDFASTTLHVE